MIVIAVLAAACLGGVTLREHEPSPAGEVLRVSTDGVTLKDTTQTVEISWDRVWSVDGSSQAAAYLGLSDKLFRARKRVERRDLVLAEPMLEDLASSFPKAGGSTGTVLHSLRVACRLMRGGQMAALEPYGALLACFSDERLRASAGQTLTRSYDGLPAACRPSPVLIPDLPPMWLAVPALRAVTGTAPVEGSGKAGELLRLYILAAASESGESVQIPAIDAGDGGELLREIVLARAGDATQRVKARELLRARLKPGIEPWRESWIHVALGRSLIRESEPDDKLAGVEQLLYAPAQFADVTPYLAGLALAESAVTLREISDPAEADQLFLELRDRYPRHVAFEWRPIREWVLSQPRPAAPGGTAP